MKKIPIGVIGAGLIGKTHIERAMAADNVELVGIADPSPAAQALAASLGVPWFEHYSAMLQVAKPRGVVVATPNVTHADVAVDCLTQKVAVLVEKPIADTLENARRICAAAAANGVPALVGHQRRYNPIMRQAKSIVDAGLLGRPVSVTALCTWLKPEEYFETSWRRQVGGGPVLINLIHDIDLLRFLFGEIESLQAITSNRIRHFEVEDTAAVMLRFRNGALGTVSVSDTTAAPWNWDLSAGEAERFARQDDVNSHFFSGTEGSLTLPRLELWRYRDNPGWQDAITVERSVPHIGCPYAEQMRHFCAVIEGLEQPVCSAEDGLRTLEATLAVHAASRSGGSVQLGGDSSWAA
ncbi:gfo/Idh/MocA family oxidoreductase [Pseudomonas sp. PB101]|uniref:Gfo/Idh/MocA family protein n=1 Tax=Pseudomonas sp. PB101 TaxID=2495428 RepID=UPI001365F0A9|nr:gfo/Idh/MocA family oxidoreductase [Pseudomonas sp. PB101]